MLFLMFFLCTVFAIGGMADRDPAVFVGDDDIFALSHFHRINSAISAGKSSLVKNCDIAVVIH